MSEPFDPYHKWLGIPPKDQPPNHYRLLGIDPHETDLDVIESAADQRMRHVRSYQDGPRQDYTQKLLNEIAGAKVCLMHAQQRYAYDLQLARKTSPVSSFPEIAAPPAFNSATSASPPAFTTSTTTPTRRKAEKNPVVELVKIVVGGVVGLLIGFLILSFVREEWDVLGLAHGPRKDTEANRPTVVVKTPPNATPVPKPPAQVDPAPNKIEKTPVKVLPPPMPPVEQEPKPPVEVTNPPDPPPQDDDVKGPPPDAEAIAKAKETLEVALQQTDVRALLTAAEEQRPAEQRYVFFVAACDQAVVAGDCSAALEVIDKLAEKFTVAKFTLQVETLTRLRDTCTTASANRELTFASMRQFEQAKKVGAKESLTPLAELGIIAARKSEDPDLVRQATLKLIEARE